MQVLLEIKNSVEAKASLLYWHVSRKRKGSAKRGNSASDILRTSRRKEGNFREKKHLGM